MEETRYLVDIDDIRTVAKDLDGVLSTTDVITTDDGWVFFDYKYGSRRGKRLMVCDEQGDFWIAKDFKPNEYIMNAYGRYFCELLGSNSPEVRAAIVNNAYMMLTKFVTGARTSERRDFENGSRIVVPRVLTAYSERRGKSIPDFVSLDINFANFLLGSDQKLYQIDFFSPETILETAYFGRIWRGRFGIAVSLDDTTIKDQLSKLPKKDDEDGVNSLYYALEASVAQNSVIPLDHYEMMAKILAFNCIANVFNIGDLVRMMEEDQNVFRAEQLKK